MTNAATNSLRNIKLSISLAGGATHEVVMREDAPELPTLYAALATPEAPHRFVQLPVDGGRVACSFHTSKVVSIVSDPPVVLNLDGAPSAVGAGTALARSPQIAGRLRRPRFVVVDNFLSQAEHDELLAYALLSEGQFQKGTVTTYEPDMRQNLVILNFGETAHSRMIENRILMWYPLVAKSLGMRVFPLGEIESHLTAASDGYYFKTHSDEAPEIPRVLTFLYYLHREPRGFAGGDLRLYDSIEEQVGPGPGTDRRPADTFTTVVPAANRLVVFPSDEFHEALPVRCPSGKFSDSRFAVATWLHKTERPDPAARFGWGHFRCGVVAPQLAGFDSTGGIS
jgi:Rps23 Pro-64 3,4-dihydroxylase Tpa1-like proline 4-hydroxylase